MALFRALPLLSIRFRRCNESRSDFNSGCSARFCLAVTPAVRHLSGQYGMAHGVHYCRRTCEAVAGAVEIETDVPNASESDRFHDPVITKGLTAMTWNLFRL